MFLLPRFGSYRLGLTAPWIATGELFGLPGSCGRRSGEGRLDGRGIEFGDFHAIEGSCPADRRRYRICCCNATASRQKASCDKNHVELRGILLKKDELR